MNLGPLMDALLRVEHKLDAIIASNGIIVAPMKEGYLCPACRVEIRYLPDFSSQTITRSCGCGHNKQAPMQGLTLTTPAGDNHGRTDNLPGRGPESGDPGHSSE